VVIGSNWGQPNHPAWSGNLIANPDATIVVEGATIPVGAELASGEERDRLRRLLIDVWPAYETYEQRAAGRELRIFRLTRRA
jgi:deazaflavin-dependent oxidoreductase (nitroreductase family)